MTTRTDAPQARSGPLRRLLSYARPHAHLFAAVLVITSALSAVTYGRALLFKPVFDDVILPAAELETAGATDWLPQGVRDWIPGIAKSPSEPPAAEALDAREAEARAKLRAHVEDSFQSVLWIALGLILAAPVLLFLREYTVQYVLGRVDLDMKVDVCAKVLRLPMRFHQEQRRGDTLQRIMGDTRQAHLALGVFFGDFLEAAVMIVVGGLMLFAINWRLALVMLLVGPIIALVISTFSRRIRKSARKRQEQSADVTQRLMEILDGIKVIKTFRAESAEDQGFRSAALKLFRRSMKVVKNRVAARSLVDLLNNAAAMGVMLLGIALLMNGMWGLSVGDLGAFVAMNISIYPHLRRAARGYVKVIDAQPSAARYFELLDTAVEIEDAGNAIPIGTIERGIEAHEVSFSYGREAVLRGVSFNAPAGQVLAIVGRTGSGKTTLTDLLLRLYDPDAGRILIDGVDLRRIQLESLLDQVAVVTQEPFLFDGTIRENIRYGRPDATDTEILAAAAAAHVDEFVHDLPEGYDTEVGGAGTRLSGGQRQRVTIARAILRDPALLVLDEATSSLDSKVEQSVQSALEALLPGRTVVVIAHRLSTVRKAHQILVLEDGRITQRGTHDELVAAGGLYRELVELQDATADGITGLPGAATDPRLA